MVRGIPRATLEDPQFSRTRARVRSSRKMQPLVPADEIFLWKSYTVQPQDLVKVDQSEIFSYIKNIKVAPMQIFM